MKVDDVEIAKQQAIRRRPLSEEQKSLLIDAGLDSFVRGGKTASPMGDLAILGLTAAAVKGAPLMIGKLGGAVKGLLKDEVAKMTVSNAAFKKGLLPELTKGGIKNWQHLRPWNAFVPRTPLTSGGTLQTAPTKGAAAALSLLIEGAGAPPAIAGGPRLPGESGADPGMGSMSREEVLRWMKDNPGGAEKMWKKWNKLHGGIKLPPV